MWWVYFIVSFGFGMWSLSHYTLGEGSAISWLIVNSMRPRV